jgi:hypothetical protein
VPAGAGAQLLDGARGQFPLSSALLRAFVVGEAPTGFVQA